MSNNPYGPSSPQGPQGFLPPSGQGQPPSGYQGPTQPQSAYQSAVGPSNAHYYAAPGAPYGGAPAEDRRPGSATTAGVMGFIFGVFGFFASTWSVVALTGAVEIGVLGQRNTQAGWVTILLLISAVAILAASVLVFLGAVQLMSGKSNAWISVAALIYIAAQGIHLVVFFVAGGREGGITFVVWLLTGVLLAGVLLYLARNSDVKAWLERRKQSRALRGY